MKDRIKGKDIEDIMAHNQTKFINIIITLSKPFRNTSEMFWNLTQSIQSVKSNLSVLW